MKTKTEPLRQFFLPHDSKHTTQEDFPTSVNDFENLDQTKRIMKARAHDKGVNLDIPRRTSRETTKPKHLEDYVWTS